MVQSCFHCQHSVWVVSALYLHGVAPSAAMGSLLLLLLVALALAWMCLLLTDEALERVAPRLSPSYLSTLHKSLRDSFSDSANGFSPFLLRQAFLALLDRAASDGPFAPESSDITLEDEGGGLLSALYDRIEQFRAKHPREPLPP